MAHTAFLRVPDTNATYRNQSLKLQAWRMIRQCKQALRQSMARLAVRRVGMPLDVSVLTRIIGTTGW